MLARRPVAAGLFMLRLKRSILMLDALKLLIPALIPSWRFFDVIAPSPRIQYALLASEQATTDQWVEFAPRPESLSFWQMLLRLIWNPGWNETLFVMSCAERLMENPAEHSENEIMNRISSNLINDKPALKNGKEVYLQFRLLVVERENDVLHESVTYYSRIEPVSMGAA